MGMVSRKAVTGGNTALNLPSILYNLPLQVCCYGCISFTNSVGTDPHVFHSGPDEYPGLLATFDNSQKHEGTSERAQAIAEFLLISIHANVGVKVSLNWSAVRMIYRQVQRVCRASRITSGRF